MQNGEIGILNVGAGHDKITFDKDDPTSMERGAKIIKQMLKSGYAILIEVPDGKGSTTTARVKGFVEGTYEYIIDEAVPEETKSHGRKRTAKKRVPVRGTRGVAVARTSGG